MHFWKLSVLLVTITIVLGGLGFALRLEGFGGNLLAELAGVSLSVWIAYGLVESLLRRQQRAQWACVSRGINTAIAARVEGVAFEFYLYEGSSSSPWLTASAPDDYAAALDFTADQLAALQGDLAGGPNDESATTRALHRSVIDDLAFVRDVLAPRVIQFGENVELVEALLALEEREREWVEGVKLIFADWGFPNELAWERAINTLRAATRLYRIVTR